MATSCDSDTMQPAGSGPAGRVNATLTLSLLASKLKSKRNFRPSLRTEGMRSRVFRIILQGGSAMTTNRQKEIALAAIKLFEQKGYHATSVQDIADEVGIQKGSLYHYIHSKEDLLMQIAYEAIVEFNQNLEHILHTEETSRDKLIQAIENHLTVSVSNLETTTVLLREAFSLGDQTHKVIQDL